MAASPGGSGDMPCIQCNGTGWVDGEGPAGTPGGGLALIALIALALSGLMALILAIEISERAQGVLRPILEAIPGDAVARTPDEHGSPAVIAVLVAILVIAGVLGLSYWRRELIRDYLRGERSYWSLFGASLLRMTAIIVGLALIAVSAAIADGADLRSPGDEGTVLDAAWRFIVAGAGIAVFAYLGLRHKIGSEGRKPLRVGDPIPAESYRR